MEARLVKVQQPHCTLACCLPELSNVASFMANGSSMRLF
ncbi:hypothetical protein SAMN05444172_2245 [Burkholderia sp. GAS332]|nr:hypothetical protein SAMN05444172_2245 [Burkholderia sp. GAS332]